MNVQESDDSSEKKAIYLIPFDQINSVPKLLKNLEDNFPNVYIDIEMNSLEDAYVNIAKAEERLHNGAQINSDSDGGEDNNEKFERYFSFVG